MSKTSRINLLKSPSMARNYSQSSSLVEGLHGESSCIFCRDNVRLPLTIINCWTITHSVSVPMPPPTTYWGRCNAVWCQLGVNSLSTVTQCQLSVNQLLSWLSLPSDKSHIVKWPLALQIKCHCLLGCQAVSGTDLGSAWELTTNLSFSQRTVWFCFKPGDKLVFPNLHPTQKAEKKRNQSSWAVLFKLSPKFFNMVELALKKEV